MPTTVVAGTQSAATRLLAIETSGLAGSIALWDDGVIDVRSIAQPGRRHAQALTLEIHELLHRHALRPRDLSGIAVSAGPGSFTGLRVGVVAAKTLGYALRCPVFAVETYLAVASCAPAEVTVLDVIGDAQRGDFFHATYDRDAAGGWHRTSAWKIVPGETWLAGLPATMSVAGPAVAKVRSEATVAQMFRESWSLEPSAASIAEIGARRLAAGHSDDVWTLAPIYLRPSAAEEQRDKRDGRTA